MSLPQLLPGVPPPGVPYPGGSTPKPPRATGSDPPAVVRPIPARTILRPQSSLARAWPCADGDFAINPYRGCQIGCVYCHARYTHEFIELGDWRDFERKIFAKTNAAQVLRLELSRLARRAPGGRGDPPTIAIGTLTDPYQPAEERLRVTRSVLCVLLEPGAPAGLRIRLTTKSDLVLRDLDLLGELSRRHELFLQLTVTTLDRDLARALEPRAPSPSRRLAALRALRDAGLAAGVLLMPIIPGVNDAEPAILALAREAKAAGALFLSEAPLLLRPSAAEPFFRFLRREYPQLERAYQEAFERGKRVPERYRERVRRRVARARRAHGLLPAPAAAAPRRPPGARAGPRPPRQLEIPL